MSKDYTMINRINEDHGGTFPDEVLNMTVGDMLNKLEELDSQDSAEYEIIEGAIRAVCDSIMSDGYKSDSDYSELGSVEADNDLEDDSSDIQGTNIDDMVSFDDMPNTETEIKGTSLDDFNF